MTLAKRMTIKSVTLALAFVLLTVSAAWGLLMARKSVRIARDEYTELHMILNLDEHLMAVKGVIETGADPEIANVKLADALRELQAFLDFQDQQHLDIAPHEEEEGEHLRSLEADLGNVKLLLTTQSEELDVDGILLSLNIAQTELKQLANEMDETIAAAQHASNQTLQVTMIVLVLVSIVMIVAIAIVNIIEYRSVVIPIRRLRDGVRRITSGQFDKSLQITGDDEISHLAGDFNKMAAELDSLYRDLEHRVREKSRELVRSERLAGIGYLAAGVAHEINNPLNIISGYAELTLRRIQKLVDVPGQEDTKQSLRIIRDESFRCKEIIEKLLSLSTNRDADRESVSFDQIVDEIVTMVGSLKQYRGRKVTIHFDKGADYHVLGNETELKQVVLNLAVNALDAVEPKVGIVQFEGRQNNGHIELIVSDNGRGMTSETQEHVFEPFYTEKMNSQKRGMGLGLSITHAIIESHGGRIIVASEGINQGSQFIVTLPAFSQKAKTK